MRLGGGGGEEGRGGGKWPFAHRVSVTLRGSSVALILWEQKVLEEGCNTPALVSTHPNIHRILLYLSHWSKLSPMQEPMACQTASPRSALTSGPGGKEGFRLL